VGTYIVPDETQHDLSEKLTKDDRNKEALLFVVENVRTPLLGREGELEKLPVRRLKVQVALDEMGRCPELVRGIISARQVIEKELRKWFACAHIVIGGTGVESGVNTAGSLPSAYEVHRFGQLCTPNLLGLMLGKYLASINENASGQAALLLGDPVLRGVSYNARAAFAIMKIWIQADPELRQRIGGLQLSDSSARLWMRALCSYLTVHAAYRYKALNGLRKLTPAEILEYSRRALQLVMLTSPPSPPSPVFDAKLLSKGIITDSAFKVARKDFDVTKHKKLAKLSDETVLVMDLGRKNRFQMTGAQAMMMCMQYGRLPPSRL